MKYIQFIILFMVILGLSHIYYIKNYSVNFPIAIVDDVIHNKYEKNTEQYYIYRNDRDEKLLKNEPYNLILYDNLAVGYDHLGKLEIALELYKTKKILLDSKKDDIENLYRYHANIGTFLIHDGIKYWFKDKTDINAQNKIIEGKNHIIKAIELNKDAHFGRENYQLIAIENLIKSFNNQSQLVDFNLLGKESLDGNKLDEKGNYKVCGKEYHSLYPEVKKEGKSESQQILDSCPMALRGLIGMIRFGGGPNPYSFVTIGDILTSMGEYKLAVAAYFRAIDLQHPNSKNIDKYIQKLSYIIYGNKNISNGYELLYNQYKQDLELGGGWSDQYVKFQKTIIKKGKDPTDKNSYIEFYKTYSYPQDLKYNRD